MVRRLSLLIGLCLTLPAHGAEIDQINTLAQPQFRLLSEDLGAALSYKPLSPGEPLGVTGFDIGVEVTATRLKNAAILEQATSDDAPGTLPIAKLHAHKGLPFGIDVGLMYSTVPDSNIDLWGAELRYAILKGGVAQPALALRASYTKLTGVSQLDFETMGLDLSVSKGFAFLTPYAGAGKVWVTSTPQGNAATFLTEEDFSLSKLFAGVNLNFGLMNFAFEADRTGDATSYGAKFGWRF
jgi:hypothetical protein